MAGVASAGVAVVVAARRPEAVVAAATASRLRLQPGGRSTVARPAPTASRPRSRSVGSTQSAARAAAGARSLQRPGCQQQQQRPSSVRVHPGGCPGRWSLCSSRARHPRRDRLKALPHGVRLCSPARVPRPPPPPCRRRGQSTTAPLAVTASLPSLHSAARMARILSAGGAAVAGVASAGVAVVVAARRPEAVVAAATASRLRLQPGGRSTVARPAPTASRPRSRSVGSTQSAARAAAGARSLQRPGCQQQQQQQQQQQRPSSVRVLSRQQPPPGPQQPPFTKQRRGGLLCGA